MSRSKAGVFGMFSINTEGLTKTADFKVTTSYLAITFKKNQQIKLPVEQKIVSGEKYQHLTIPPDLQVHLSPKNRSDGYIFPNKRHSPLNNDGELSQKYFKLLTVCFPPISSLEPTKSNKIYTGGTMMIAMEPMPHWKADTGYFFELFAVNGNHREIPKEEHYRKDRLGTLLPIHVSEVFPNANDKNYYFMPYFGEYDDAETDSIKIYFFNTDKQERK